MFERQLQSLNDEIGRNVRAFETLKKMEPFLSEFLSADDLINRFLLSKDAAWKNEVLSILIQTTKKPILQQFCSLMIIAVFWRNITFLATSCDGRQITPEDLHSQASLILLEHVSKAARKNKKGKLCINLALNLRRDFYLWVKEIDFQFYEIPESQEELNHPTIGTDNVIRRIIKSKVLSKSDIEFYLDLKRDGRKVATIAKERGVKPNTLRKKLQRIEKKMSRFSALKG